MFDKLLDNADISYGFFSSSSSLLRFSSKLSSSIKLLSDLQSIKFNHFRIISDCSRDKILA